MQAYILCGGFGTRLQSVLQGGQKAAADIDGRPFLSLLLHQLQAAGVTQAVLCAHYRADQLAQLLPTLAGDSGLALDLVVEEQPMGTGGAVLNALREVPPIGRFLVLNADTYLDQRAYRLALAVGPAALVAVQVADRTRYGSVRYDAEFLLQALDEKNQSGPGYVNAGVYAFPEQALARFPVKPCSMEKELLPALIQGGQLIACEYSGPFVDIGTPESLNAFRAQFQGFD
ncbi:sugar phosphate nucleotidyltransferase [Pseudomonas sp. RL]|uniref:sugar phosphate nucleotidyltransferase n=1 Tax=Pseudomonas sp. RL TaxID=1452718 RepID=UPI000487B46F|nr:sugar phosphate nucleotidyltransferase [Pseudomonas sp. RL]